MVSMFLGAIQVPEVVLVQPHIGHWDSLKSRPDLPLGLLQAASLVVSEFDTVLIDQRADPNWKKHLKRELNQSPLFVGTTAMTGQQIKHALEISHFVKQESPIPVVWGGVHGSLLPEQTVINNDIDIVVRGDGEIPLLQIAQRLSNNKNLKCIKGITYKEKRIIRNNPDQDPKPLSSYPLPAYDIVRLGDYVQERRGYRMLPIETSRGCPYACRFCYNKLFNKRQWRALNPSQIMERVEALVEKVKINGINIIDDNFFVDKKRSLSFAKKLVDSNQDLIWYSQGMRVNYFDAMEDNEIGLLERSGLREGNFGIESGSPSTLKMIDKKITIEQVLRVNKKLKAYDIIPRYNFIIGFPYEDYSDFKKTVNLCLRLLQENPRCEISHIAAFTPYPGTDLFYTAIKLGLEPPETLEGWAQYAWHNVNLPWLDNKMKSTVEAIYFLSNCMDNKLASAKNTPPFIRLLSVFYKPISSFRLSHEFYSFMIEKRIKNLLIGDW